ncbi:MAG: hypothetical protein AAB354_03365 [candidate division KSB1 bacterium]
MRNWKRPSFSNLMLGVIIILLMLAFHFQDQLAQWLVRLSMSALFCVVIYLREHTSTDRWLTIGIIVGGTLLSLLLIK